MDYKIKKRLIISVLFTICLPGRLVMAQTTDNAALLYYQAFMLYTDPGEEIRVKLNDIFQLAISERQGMVMHPSLKPTPLKEYF